MLSIPLDEFKLLLFAASANGVTSVGKPVLHLHSD